MIIMEEQLIQVMKLIIMVAMAMQDTVRLIVDKLLPSTKIHVIFIFLDYGYGYEAPPAPVSATRGRGNICK